MDTIEKQVRKPKQKRSLEKMELIRSSAQTLFSEKGYFSTTTNEIAKCAGISIGTLYSYYKDKKDIYEDLVRAHYEKSAEQAAEANFPADLSPRHTIYLMLAATMQAHLVNSSASAPSSQASKEALEIR